MIGRGMMWLWPLFFVAKHLREKQHIFKMNCTHYDKNQPDKKKK